MRPTFILLILFNSRRRYFSTNELFRKYGTADGRRYTQMRKPFVAHDPSPKRRPSCQLFKGFSVKTILILFRQTFIIRTSFNSRRRYFSINELFRKIWKPQMDADKRRCEIHLRRMNIASKDAPALRSLRALRL